MQHLSARIRLTDLAKYGSFRAHLLSRSGVDLGDRLPALVGFKSDSLNSEVLSKRVESLMKYNEMDDSQQVAFRDFLMRSVDRRINEETEYTNQQGGAL